MNNVASKSYQLLINGKWVDASDGGTLKSYCPANGEYLSTMANATKEDVDAAVKAAWQAFDSWKATSPEQRMNMLLKIADIMEENKEKLAMLECLDNGKPIWEEMNFDIPGSIDHFRYFAGACRTETGEATMLNDELMSIILREPIGVVGQIIPWNYPINMLSWKLAPVLAAGCCTVVKPSSTACLGVIEFAKMISDVLPAGVFNLVTGSGSKSGQYLLDHPDITKLAFTGSTEVGLDVARAAAEKIIPATLELGGKSAVIVFDDAKDLDQVVEGVQMGILINQGQICCAGSRVFVQEDIYDAFVEKAVAAFNNVKMGMPWERDTMMGSQISEAQAKKILDYVEIGKKEGAKVLCGGYHSTENGMDKGAFVAPTLLAATNDMRVAQEEIFGPVAVVIKFKTEEEVIAMANDSEYGLGGGVWTTDVNRAIRVSRAVQTGRMWVNCNNVVMAGAPFGGYKRSGIGRETHRVILEHYTEMKNVMFNLHEGVTGAPFGDNRWK
ncbi:MAG: aldehyde dehydrogenase family protein [Oscillospiraceae bacterium]|nr:aldehyde dehydrogenase family protein [Oscillospiraceae bacterium]